MALQPASLTFKVLNRSFPKRRFPLSPFLEMDSKSIDEDLVEERQELMVIPRKNKSHFLKPTIVESRALLRPASSPYIKPPPFYISFRAWRFPSKSFKLWAKKMAALHKPIWIKAGIFEAIIASTYKIHKNPSLILSLAQKWCPETKSFVFPWGEATITLEDVNVLLRFPVLGSSVFAPLQSSEMEEAVVKLEKHRRENVTGESWIWSFADDEIEHEAFLVYWLSNFVFPNNYNFSISKDVFPIAVRLARGEKIALAPAVLASLYRDLGLIRTSAPTQNVYIKSLFKLIQVWMWERMKNMRPEAKVLTKGEPRIAQWSGLTQRIEDVGVILLDDFEWRPYVKPLKNWNPPAFYSDKAKWITTDDDSEFVSFARCMSVSKLVGIGIVEDYYPNRVAMQFGWDQDVPGLVTHRSSNNFTQKEAWDHYNQSLNGLKLYIPSCFTTGSVTARYRDWWTMKSVWETQKKPIIPSDTVDIYDDVSLKVLPLSQVLEKLEDEKKKAECFTHKRCKTLDREDHDKNATGCYQTQDDDDDNMTITQVTKPRKECSNVENNTKGDRSKLETDKTNVVLDLPQKLPSTDETVATKNVALSITGETKSSSDPHVAVNQVDEKEERVKQRKLAVEKLALNLEARMLKVENTLAMIREWKLRRIHTKAPFCA